MLTVKLLKAFPQVFVKGRGNREMIRFLLLWRIWEQTDGSFFAKWQFLIGSRLSPAPVYTLQCKAGSFAERKPAEVTAKIKKNTWVIQQFKVYGNEVSPHSAQSFVLVFLCSSSWQLFVVQCNFFWQCWRPFSSFVFKVKPSEYKAWVKPEDRPPKLINVCPDWSRLSWRWWQRWGHLLAEHTLNERFNEREAGFHKFDFSHLLPASCETQTCVYRYKYRYSRSSLAPQAVQHVHLCALNIYSLSPLSVQVIFLFIS